MSAHNPYGRGRDAANRVGEYQGYRHLMDLPKCPYGSGTPEAQAWWSGFADATEDTLHWTVLA
jgi:hypothetical protein